VVFISNVVAVINRKFITVTTSASSTIYHHLEEHSYEIQLNGCGPRSEVDEDQLNLSLFFLEKEKRKQNNIILIKEKSGFSTCRPPSGLELTIHQVNPLGRFQSKGLLLQN
jgi:hypothetical protein